MLAQQTKNGIPSKQQYFRKHIEETHPTITSNEMPPDHTLTIEANITSSQAKNSNQKIDKHLCHWIITNCGDANAMMGTKHIDLLLCLNVKRYLINYLYLSDYGQTIFCLSFSSRDRATTPGRCE